MKRVVACCLVLVALAPSLVWAQPVAAPEPVVTATIDPQHVVVGQKATLLVTVLAPNYMPTPPALPDFQVRNAVTRRLGAVNQVDQREGVTYAGVQYEFAVFPQEPGFYSVSDQKITVTYANDPPRSRTVSIALPRIAFEAFIPDPAQHLDPFIAAARLTLTQEVKQSSHALKVGDSVTRTLTVKADGTPAMLLPVTTFAKIDGLAVYPGQPAVQDNFDQRTSALSAVRIDEATYMLEKPGSFTLPAIELAWWNVRDGKIEHARADAIVLHVTDNPALQESGSIGRKEVNGQWRAFLDWVFDHVLLSAVVLLTLIAASWIAPRAVRSLRHRIALKREAYLSSEAWSFAQLQAAARGHDPKKIYMSLLDWLERFGPLKPLETISAFKQSAQDPELDHEIALLEGHAFGPPGGESVKWSPRRLMKQIKLARRRLLRPPASAMAKMALPKELNPIVTYPQRQLKHRPVAR
jgi:hypothetical protein